jgi:hypothetical protein
VLSLAKPEKCYSRMEMYLNMWTSLATSNHPPSTWTPHPSKGTYPPAHAAANAAHCSVRAPRRVCRCAPAFRRPELQGMCEHCVPLLSEWVGCVAGGPLLDCHAAQSDVVRNQNAGGLRGCHALQ